MELDKNALDRWLTTEPEPRTFYRDCDECGAEFLIDEVGVSHHLDEDGEFDWDTDRDHAAYCLEDDE